MASINVQNAWKCPHCSQYLSRKSFMYHKRLYYNPMEDCWVEKRRRLCDRAVPVEFDEMEVEVDKPSTPEAYGAHRGCRSHATDSPPPLVGFDSDEDESQPCHEQTVSEDVHVDVDIPQSHSDSSVDQVSAGDEMWADDPSVFSDFDTEPTGMEFPSENTSENSMIAWMCIFLLSLRAAHKIPDAAIVNLVKFLSTFLKVLANYPHLLAGIAELLPDSLRKIEQTVGYQRGTFGKYVVCPQCASLHDFKEASSQGRNNKCLRRLFSRDPPCSANLLKTVHLQGGRSVLYPHLVYCYNGLLKGLQALLLQPGFAELCEKWRSRHTTEYIDDVYDGRIWSEFQTFASQPFLSLRHTFAFMLNVDWFNPFELSQYSTGAIYLSVMNLPRSLRFKRENIILVGLLPGPYEQRHDINSFLTPIVDELLKIWDGVQMTIVEGGRKISCTIRGALLCVAADMPASRKVCGFLSHSATFGCSRCLKKFPGSVGTMDYSGFNRDTWPTRDLTVHRSNVKALLKAQCKSQRAAAESKFGCRYSELLRLPYFNPIRMTIVDPMHNLFLGTAKQMFKSVWPKADLLGANTLDTIQSRVDSTSVPSGVGRIPRKIKSHFASFTAEEWKNWVILYSVYCLRDLLPEQHLECWRHFVLACRYLCKRSLLPTDIKIIDALLLQFCRRVEHLYGKEAITPNMHMHCHLHENLSDYGPVYAFWLFSFERYNGVLGNQPTNNRNIESQLLEHFIEDNAVLTAKLPAQFSANFFGHIKHLHRRLDTATVYTQPTESNPQWSIDCCDIHLPQRGVCSLLSDVLKPEVVGLYHKFYPSSCVKDTDVGNAFFKYSSITVNSKSYSSLAGLKRNSTVMINWNTTLFGPPKEYADIPQTASFLQRPGIVDYYVKHSFTVNDVPHWHVFAVVSWLMPHPKHLSCGKPVTIWCKDFYDSNLPGVVPIQLFASLCVLAEDTIDSEQVLFVTPLIH